MFQNAELRFVPRRHEVHGQRGCGAGQRRHDQAADQRQRLGATLTGIDPPTLRDVWATAPYLHDGSAATLADAVRAHTGVNLSTTDVNAVSAYLSQIGSEEATAPLPPPPPPASGSGLIGRYFNNRTLTGTPALTRTEVVNFDWASNAPGTGIGRDNFSVRWTGEVKTTVAGAYRFRTVSDDGVSAVGQRRAGDQQLDVALGDDRHEHLDQPRRQHALHDQDGVLRADRQRGRKAPVARAEQLELRDGSA